MLQGIPKESGFGFLCSVLCCLASLTLQDQFQISWHKLLSATLNYYGVYPAVLISVGFDEAKVSFKQCARIIALQNQLN